MVNITNETGITGHVSVLIFKVYANANCASLLNALHNYTKAQAHLPLGHLGHAPPPFGPSTEKM